LGVGEIHSRGAAAAIVDAGGVSGQGFSQPGPRSLNGLAGW
jgi:hypothetical protein